jgi:hypothetical protein
MRVKGKKAGGGIRTARPQGGLSAEQHRVIEIYLEGLEAYKRRDFKTGSAI